MDLLTLTYPLSGVLMAVIPFGLSYYLARRYKLGGRLWWIAASTFILSQIGLIPFSLVVSGMFEQGRLPIPQGGWAILFNAVLVGVSAGVFEELARYAMLRWWAKDARSWPQGLLAGLGHGGVEAIVIGLLVLFAFYQMSGLRQADLSAVVPAEQLDLARQQVATFWSMPWHIPLLDALDRLFDLACQISYPILILQAFLRQQSRWVGAAVLWHALVDGVASLTKGSLPYLAAEGIMALLALISLGLVFALRWADPSAAPEPPAPPKPLSVKSLKPANETPESLEKSRYT
jgi:uncharacterized membrane protein YhfC